MEVKYYFTSKIGIWPFKGVLNYDQTHEVLLMESTKVSVTHVPKSHLKITIVDQDFY